LLLPNQKIVIIYFALPNQKVVIVYLRDTGVLKVCEKKEKDVEEFSEDMMGEGK